MRFGAILLGLILCGCGGSEPESKKIEALTILETSTEDSSYVAICSSTEENSDAFPDCVESFNPSVSAPFGFDTFPENLFGPPEGVADGMSGSVSSVLSLGCGGEITLYFEEPGIVNGEGADFTVFENAFWFGSQTFAEPAEVSVSVDGENWKTYPCSFTNSWPPVGCAGVMPSLASPSNGISWRDPNVSGGDAFDLSDVGLEKAHFVRLQDKSVEYNQALGSNAFCFGNSGGFDLDTVAFIH